MELTPDLVEILKDISEYISFSTSEAFGASTVASVFGSQIPVGSERNIWEITASAEDGSSQLFGIFTGNGPAAYETTRYLRQRTPVLATAGPFHVGGDPRKPFKIINPVTAVNVVDRLAAVQGAAIAVNLEISYYDTPLRLTL